MGNFFLPNGNFLFVLLVFLLSLSLFSILHIYVLCPHVTYSPTTHNTIIHASGQIRTRNPSKRSAEVPRLRRLGHWDRRKSSPRPSDQLRQCVPRFQLYILHMYGYTYVWVCVCVRVCIIHAVNAKDICTDANSKLPNITAPINCICNSYAYTIKIGIIL